MDKEIKIIRMMNIRSVIEILNNGGIIAFPTDTVCGIGCDAFNRKAIERIYEIKKREKEKQLILFVKNKSEVEKYVKEIPKIGKTLMKKYWPGPLTIIFNSKNNTEVKGDKIGIRIPNHNTVLEILTKYDKPLATTSANISGEPPAIHSSEIKLDVDLIIPGECNIGKPSTVIDITSSPPKIIREGAIKLILWKE